MSQVWSGPPCVMCSGTGNDRTPITERRGMFYHVVGWRELVGVPCRNCNGHGREAA